MTEIIMAKKILVDDELQKIAVLAESCNQSDGLELKLNWETININLYFREGIHYATRK